MTREVLTSLAPAEGVTNAVVDRFARTTDVDLLAIPTGPVMQRTFL